VVDIHTHIHATNFIERQNREERIGGAGTEFGQTATNAQMVKYNSQW